MNRLLIGTLAYCVLFAETGIFRIHAQTLERADELVEAQEELGHSARSCLVDESIQIRTRLRCAVILGKIRYDPALANLIELIELEDPNRLYNEANYAQRYPCLGAIAQFGVGALPLVMAAYMREEDPQRLRLLTAVIWAGPTADKAIVYARGYAVTDGTPEAERKAETLVHAILNK